jgi:predicted esterase
MRVAAGVGIAALLLAVTAASAAARPASNIFRVEDRGDGAREVWIYLPESAPPCAVLFLHGAGDLSPARYQAWLDYLTIGKKCAVIFPRYQASVGPITSDELQSLRASVAASFAYLRAARFGLYGDPVPDKLAVVAVGFAQGATLAIYYAANARRWGLPVPAAVDSVFPATAGVSLPALGPLPRSTRLLIQVGDRDRVGGPAAGQALWRMLASHPASRKRLQVVHAGHGVPLQRTDAATTTFWAPLDAFIDAALP